MTAPEIKLTELRGPLTSPYFEEWACDPPDIGLSYQVLRDEWRDEEPGRIPTRTIHEVKVLGVSAFDGS